MRFFTRHDMTEKERIHNSYIRGLVNIVFWICFFIFITEKWSAFEKITDNMAPAFEAQKIKALTEQNQANNSKVEWIYQCNTFWAEYSNRCGYSSILVNLSGVYCKDNNTTFQMCANEYKLK